MVSNRKQKGLSLIMIWFKKFKLQLLQNAQNQ